MTSARLQFYFINGPDKNRLKVAYSLNNLKFLL